MEVHATPSPGAAPTRPAHEQEPTGFLERAMAERQKTLGSAAHQGRLTLFGEDGFGFDDILDAINPLQHIPIISTVYRSLTQDEIAAVPRLAGGALFGGVVGLAAAAVNAAIDDSTGRDMGEHVYAALFGEPDGAGPAPTMTADAQTGGSEAALAPASGPAASGASDAPGSEQAPAQPASAARRPGPAAWYLAGRAGKDAAGPTAEAMEPSGTEAAPAPVAAREPSPGRAAPAAPAPAAAADGADIPQLTPAQIELLLASLGRKTDLAVPAKTGRPAPAPAGAAGAPARQPGPAAAPAADQVPRAGPDARVTVAPPRDEAAPSPGPSRPASGESMPLPERIQHGLEKYRESGRALPLDRSKVNVVQ